MRFAMGPATTDSRRRWWIRLLILLVAMATVATAIAGLRTWRSLTLLGSAYEAGVPQASSVRPWMTLRYVAATYRAPGAALRERLGLAPLTPPDTTLKALAARAGVSPPDYARRVQRAIAAVAAAQARPRDDEATNGFFGIGDDFVSAILVYGYPALGLTLLLGALGAPLPSGLSMIVAGSLAAQGQLRWELLATVAVAASVAGDIGGYGIGRVLGGSFLERRGHWLGLTPDRRARVERLLNRWGALGVVLSRSLVSVLSSAVNLVAGAGRYRLGAFVAFGIVGRLAWTSAYLGLGYIGSGGLEPATDVLRSLTGLLVSIALLVTSGIGLRRSSARRAVRTPCE